MKNSLQSRIVYLMIVFSLIVIGLLTFILVTDQASDLTRFNKYRSKLASIIVKDKLDAQLETYDAQDPTQKASLENVLATLAGTGVADEIQVADPAGTVLASHKPSETGQRFSGLGLQRIESIAQNPTAGKWFYPYVSQDGRRLDVYIPKVDFSGKVHYVARAGFSLGNIQDAINQVFGSVLFTVAVVLGINAILGVTLSKTIVAPLKTLERATAEVAGGNLDKQVLITTGDEIEALAETFNTMTTELQHMTERAQNANPLTHLPGNNVIHEQIDTRIQNGSKFTVIYSDLDNFKALNDKYGVGQGDKAIMMTAEVFKETVQKVGNPTDFVGHEGGDDFILITTPDKAKSVADSIIQEFDKRVRSLYEREDLKRGYIEAENRQGVLCKFPIMSISLAGVTNEFVPLKNYAEITNLTAEVKHKAKAIAGSVFVVETRQASHAA